MDAYRGKKAKMNGISSVKMRVYIECQLKSAAMFVSIQERLQYALVQLKWSFAQNSKQQTQIVRVAFFSLHSPFRSNLKWDLNYILAITVF